MSSPEIGAVAAVCLVGTVVALMAIGPPRQTPLPPPPPPEVVPTSVSAGGFTLTSATLDLPAEDALFPDGDGADTMNANCTACHSASFAMAQPKLTAAKWKETVEKMRDVYKAPVADGDVDAIIAYLVAFQSDDAG